MFYFPHWLWKFFERGQLSKILEKEDSKDKDPDVIRIRQVNRVVNFLRNRWRKDKCYCYKYFFCEFLCLFNVIGQMFLLDAVFNGEYLHYGVDALKYFYYGPPVVLSPFIRIFPRVTSCTFNYYGEAGGLRNYSALCVLAVNAINEKIFLLMWFWFVILSVITFLALVSKLILFSSHNLRFLSLKTNFKSVNPNHFQYVVKNGDSGDYLFVYLLGQNMDESFFKNVIVELLGRFGEKEC